MLQQLLTWMIEFDLPHIEVRAYSRPLTQEPMRWENPQAQMFYGGSKT
jgi:hypothetical protein